MLTTSSTPTNSSIERLLSIATTRKYQPRSTIKSAETESKSICYIVKGTVSVIIEGGDGREIIVNYLNSGQYFGETGLFQLDEREKYTRIKAKGPCEVAEVEYDQFRELVNEDPELLLSLMEQLVSRLKTTTRKVGDLVFLDVTRRVEKALWDLSRQPDAMTHPDGMQIKVTRQEIGRIVGCSREMVGRVLKTLEAEGAVSVSGKTMVVFGAR